VPVMPVYDKSFRLILLLSALLFGADPQSEIETLKNRITQLESAKNSQGTLRLSSMETTMFLGGRITLDSIYLSDANGKDGGSNSNDQFFGASYIPIDPQGESDELSLTARNSRFWIKTRTQQAKGQPIMTLLEFDLWGSSGTEKNTNSHNPRIRHAYMIYNNWTIGQTNSLFLGTSKPHTLLAPVDNILMRQPLIAYKKKFPHGTLGLSLEEPESLILFDNAEKSTINDDQLPDLIVRYDYYQPQYAYSLSLLGREIRINQEDGSTQEASTFGYGLNFTAHLHTYQNNTLSMGLRGGEGIGRYLATGFFPDAVLTEDQTLHAQRSWGGDIAYEHWLNPKLRLNIAYGAIKTDNILKEPTLDQSSYSVHLGVGYSPIKRLLFALEYIDANRQLQDNSNHTLQRLYFRSSYDF